MITLHFAIIFMGNSIDSSMVKCLSVQMSMSALNTMEAAVICATTLKEVIPVSAIQGLILQKTVSNVQVSHCGWPI